MRVAVIGSRGIPASHGGIERHVEELYCRLAKMGCEATVFARRAYVALQSEKVDWEKPLRRGGYRGARLKVLRAPSAKGLEALVHSLWATLVALPGRYDLYHYHALGPSLFAFLPMLFGKRVAVTCHGLDWQRAKWGKAARGYLRLCERFIGRRVPHLICVSEDLKDYFDRTYQRESHYIPNGADIPERIEAEEIPQWGLKAGQYIVFFGRLTPEKEVHTLVEAFQRVDSPVRLAVVGGAGQAESYLDGLKAQAAERVAFTGYAYGEALNRLVANSLFVVNPSRLEGLPITVLEAYALGKHVLASDIPPHRQVIRDEAWLFPAGDVEALAQRLRELLARPRLPVDETLIQRVREEYNWDRVAEQTWNLFQRIVGA